MKCVLLGRIGNIGSWDETAQENDQSTHVNSCPKCSPEDHHVAKEQLYTMMSGATLGARVKDLFESIPAAAKTY